MLPIKYLHFEQIDSTATWTKAHAAELDPSALTAVYADEQTAGRARSHRTWFAPRGNLYLSLFFTLPPAAACLPNVGQLLSLLCAQKFSLSIKWPNDLIVNQKKIGGVLTEATTLGNQTAVILSIGLNVNMDEELLSRIGQPATSLSTLTGRLWNIQEVLTTLTESFALQLPTLQKEGFRAFFCDYEKLLAYKGEKITFHQGSQKIEGICEGITEEGLLKLRDASSNTLTFISGEITSN